MRCAFCVTQIINERWEKGKGKGKGKEKREKGQG